MALPTTKTGKVSKQDFFDHAIEINRLAANYVTASTTSTRVDGGVFHIFNNPAVDPGAAAVDGDWWIGDVVV